ncbi:MAG: biosynthetic-type acetolactate synthase large subunit [Lachnospiraceae bacterium]|nr:biosynthetic-type acetolactate synthase large subunit [Lachnospiraceae bacterium]
MTGADIMVKCLVEEGVTEIYGYPGVAIAPFYEAVRASGKIHSTLVRTEQSAAHAASGFTRVKKGVPGVCAVTSGPGATNLITGIATAFADSIPLVCITGQVKSELMGGDVFQEADITGACESFVKYSYLVRDVDDIPRIMKEAFHVANTGRKGPVLIDVPIDMQQAEVKRFTYPAEVNMRTYKPTVKGNMVQINKVIKELEKAKRPLIYAGGGVLLSDAGDKLEEFAAKHSIPVVSTMMGIGVLPTDHPLYFGMVGNNGKAYANRAVAECDVIIVVGARVADRAVNQPDLITKDKVMIHIDVDPAEIGKNAGPSIPLVGDAYYIFDDLLVKEYEADYTEWLEKLSEYKARLSDKPSQYGEYVDAPEFIRRLTEAMDDDAIYVADVGQNQMWSCGYAKIVNGQFLTTGGMGTMGYSIPAAMGAKMAAKDKQVVAVCGDGSFQMSMCELATIRQNDVPVKIIVFNNGYLGLVRQFQHYNYADNYSVVDLSGNPDLSKLAAAYDMPFIRVNNMSEVDDAIKKFLKDDTRYLMECMINPLANC